MELDRWLSPLSQQGTSHPPHVLNLRLSVREAAAGLLMMSAVPEEAGPGVVTQPSSVQQSASRVELSDVNQYVLVLLYPSEFIFTMCPLLEKRDCSRQPGQELLHHRQLEGKTGSEHSYIVVAMQLFLWLVCWNLTFFKEWIYHLFPSCLLPSFFLTLFKNHSTFCQTAVASGWHVTSPDLHPLCITLPFS